MQQAFTVNTPRKKQIPEAMCKWRYSRIVANIAAVNVWITPIVQPNWFVQLFIKYSLVHFNFAAFHDFFIPRLRKYIYNQNLNCVFDPHKSYMILFVEKIELVVTHGWIFLGSGDYFTSIFYSYVQITNAN